MKLIKTTLDLFINIDKIAQSCAIGCEQDRTSVHSDVRGVTVRMFGIDLRNEWRASQQSDPQSAAASSLLHCSFISGIGNWHHTLPHRNTSLDMTPKRHVENCANN
ncbi:hypothetical protein RR48_13354 [Papilio machaon]|uniref:Uncharacterized protein n=1 Tax=Papilio machaon TaxID=76193 RepID=A0A194QXN5_PAPMA|nr:hypothetical protein RR48_13354 [Papilio machaon]